MLHSASLNANFRSIVVGSPKKGFKNWQCHRIGSLKQQCIVNYIANFSIVLQRAAKLALQATVYATAYPSISLSVRHTCVKTKECREMRSSLSGNPMFLVFLMQRMVDRDDPVQVKFECKEVDTLRKQPSCTHLAS